MVRPRRPERLEPLKAAIYALGQRNASFDVTDLGKELKYRSSSDKQFLSNTLYRWFKAGIFTQLPRTGIHNLYQVKDGKLGTFRPAPPKPAPTPLPAPSLQSAPSPQPATLDALMHSWLDAQLRPYGTMLRAVVEEVNRVRKDLDSVMDLLSKP